MHIPSLIAVVIALPLHSTSASPLPDLPEFVRGEVCNVISDLTFLKCKTPNEGGPLGNPTKIYGNHEGSVSSHPDGSGTFVSKDDYFKWPSGDECWTDLYKTSSSKNTTEWKLQAKNDCGGNSSECQAGIDNGVQTCNEWSLEVEAGAELTLLHEIFSLNTKVGATSGGKTCESIGKNMKCTWKDQGCHAVWTRMTGTIDYGYIRRRCNKGGEGDKTVWSKDWTLSEKADSVELGCKASCDATTYPA